MALRERHWTDGALGFVVDGVIVANVLVGVLIKCRL